MSENLKGKGHLGDLSVDGRIILKYMIKNCELQATNEHGNELVDSVKGRGFLDRLKESQLLKHHYAARSYLLYPLVYKFVNEI